MGDALGNVWSASYKSREDRAWELLLAHYRTEFGEVGSFARQCLSAVDAIYGAPKPVVKAKVKRRKARKRA